MIGWLAAVALASGCSLLTTGESSRTCSNDGEPARLVSVAGAPTTWVGELDFDGDAFGTWVMEFDDQGSPAFLHREGSRVPDAQSAPKWGCEEVFMYPLVEGEVNERRSGSTQRPEWRHALVEVDSSTDALRLVYEGFVSDTGFEFTITDPETLELRWYDVSHDDGEIRGERTSLMTRDGS